MGSTTLSPGEREQRFRDVYDAAYADLLRFVRRRVHPTHAEDVVGDVMLVAWRRLDDVRQTLRPRAPGSSAWPARLSRTPGAARSGTMPSRYASPKSATTPRMPATTPISSPGGPTSPQHGRSSARLTKKRSLSPSSTGSPRPRRQQSWASHPPPFACGCPVPGAPCDGISAPPKATPSRPPRFREEPPMRQHRSDPRVTAALRHLDPAPRTGLTEEERERADAAFLASWPRPATSRSGSTRADCTGVRGAFCSLWVWQAPPQSPVSPSQESCSAGATPMDRGHRDPRP